MGKALSINKVETYFSTVGQLIFLKHVSCPFKLNYFLIVGTGKQPALIVSSAGGNDWSDFGI